ncbi:MAG: hypothetical protein VX642_09090 [Bdellovibrionota bacterium]|nr:hypothetical protein [Bdellovibrionota bacterium]
MFDSKLVAKLVIDSYFNLNGADDSRRIFDSGENQNINQPE